MRAAALTPQMGALLQRIRRAARPAFHTLTPDLARAAYAAGAEVLDLPRAPLARVEELSLPLGASGALRARLYAPTHDRLPLMMFAHGGGFTIGGLETHDSLCRQFALGAGIAVVAIDYRLAPEHPFPAAVEDCWAAMHWLARHGADLGLDAARMAVGGDSAGGTLAAVCALHARDRGLPLALQLLITPGTAAFADTSSHEVFANGYLLEAADIAWFFDHYIAATERDDWRFAPLHAHAFEGVAPAMLLLAECDPLVDEGIAYGDRLREAGVAVELELVRGVTHDFIKMGRAIPEARTAQAACAAALRRALHP